MLSVFFFLFKISIISFLSSFPFSFSFLRFPLSLSFQAFRFLFPLKLSVFFLFKLSVFFSLFRLSVFFLFSNVSIKPISSPSHSKSLFIIVQLLFLLPFLRLPYKLSLVYCDVIMRCCVCSATKNQLKLGIRE